MFYSKMDQKLFNIWLKIDPKSWCKDFVKWITLTNALKQYFKSKAYAV